MLRSLLRVALLAALFTAGSSLPAVEPTHDSLDWDAWQRMPVLHNGRLKPLDTFARLAADTITGRTNPTLSLEEAGAPADSPEMAAARELFPDGKPRKFTAAEMLFSWLVEPERWERVPFLVAAHHQLREDVLGVKLTGSDGSLLKHVSPYQVSQSRRFRAKLAELGDKMESARAKNDRFEAVGLDKKAEELYEAYGLFRMITFDASRLGSARSDPLQFRNRLMNRLGRIHETWQELEPGLAHLGRMSPDVTKLADAGNRLLETAHGKDIALAGVEPLVREFERLSRSLSTEFQLQMEKMRKAPPADWQPEQLEQTLVQMRTISTKTADLAHRAREARLALYDNGNSLAVLPALESAALEKNRDPKVDDSQAWLSLATVLLGSDSILEGYPKPELEAVRRSFAETKRIYLDRAAADRPEQFAAAMNRFTSDLRALGESLEPIRQQLPIQQRDEELIAMTAYPPVGSTDVEMFYNRADPFLWSWSISLAGLIALAVSMVAWRRPLFWIGIAALITGQAATVAGLGLRSYITGFAPVTNMFETVIFVALVVAVLGLWFTLLPLLWSGLVAGWRLTALPLGWEARQAPRLDISRPTASLVRWLLVLPRLALAVGLFYVLTQLPYGSGGSVIFTLLPQADVGSIAPNWSDRMTWAVGLCVLAVTVWYLPRVLLAGLLSLGTIPLAWRREGTELALERTLERAPFAVVGAAVAFLAAALAYFAPAPVFVREIGPLRPVLRDNFWLLIHVLTITASYGAGALAWGLGNIALGYYLFGRYREPATHAALLASHGDRPAGGTPHGLSRRAPEGCATLAGFIYKATQVAVLLLIAGTILGALWADKAWGRFWGWDSKEVWALVSALVYLVILHGRYAGYFGNFGLAAGSVMGASAIIMAWYGVNFVLGSGLHTYGDGAGGQIPMALIVLGNWAFLIAAAIRHAVETASPATVPSPLPEVVADRALAEPAGKR